MAPGGVGPSFFFFRALLEPAKYPIQQGRSWLGLWTSFFFANRRGLRRDDPPYRRLLPNGSGFLSGRRKRNLLGWFFYSLVTRLNFAQFYVVVAQSADAVVRRFKINIRDQATLTFKRASMPEFPSASR